MPRTRINSTNLVHTVWIDMSLVCMVPVIAAGVDRPVSRAMVLQRSLPSTSMTALGSDFLKSVIFTAAWPVALAREEGKREVTASLQVGLSAMRA